MDGDAADDFDAPILIVDDTADNVTLLSFVLKRAGYRNVRTTADPREGVDLYRELRPRAVLLDLHMPGMSGFDVLRQLAPPGRTGEALPVLMLTADIDADARSRALALGAREFVVKPLSIHEVLRQVREMIADGVAKPSPRDS